MIPAKFFADRHRQLSAPEPYNTFAKHISFAPLNTNWKQPSAALHSAVEDSTLTSPNESENSAVHVSRLIISVCPQESRDCQWVRRGLLQQHHFIEKAAVRGTGWYLYVSRSYGWRDNCHRATAAPSVNKSVTTGARSLPFDFANVPQLRLIRAISQNMNAPASPNESLSLRSWKGLDLSYPFVEFNWKSGDSYALGRWRNHRALINRRDFFNRRWRSNNSTACWRNGLKWTGDFYARAGWYTGSTVDLQFFISWLRVLVFHFPGWKRAF